MARRKPTEEDIQARQVLASTVVKFRKNNLFTQKKLADTLGVCRRTIQMIEGARITPQSETLRLWNALEARYREANAS